MTEEANEAAVNYASNETQQQATASGGDGLAELKQGQRHPDKPDKLRDGRSSQWTVEVTLERRSLDAPVREMTRWDGIVGYRWEIS